MELIIEHQVCGGEEALVWVEAELGFEFFAVDGDEFLVEHFPGLEEHVCEEVDVVSTREPCWTFAFTPLCATCEIDRDSSCEGVHRHCASAILDWD